MRISNAIRTTLTIYAPQRCVHLREERERSGYAVCDASPSLSPALSTRRAFDTDLLPRLREAPVEIVFAFEARPRGETLFVAIGARFLGFKESLQSESESDEEVLEVIVIEETDEDVSDTSRVRRELQVERRGVGGGFGVEVFFDRLCIMRK